VRVGLVVYGSLDLVSGGNLYDRKLSDHLRARGHEVEILSIPSRGYAFDVARNFSPFLRRRIRSSACDVLLEDELVHPSRVLFQRSRTGGPARPVVAIVHHLRSSEERPDWQNDVYRKIEKRYLASVDAFVFNSHTTRETVEALLAKKTRNVVATPGGDRFPRSMTPGDVLARAHDPGELRLLFVGNLIPRKGLHVLLESLATIRERSFHLDVVGSPAFDRSYAAKIRDRVSALGLESRIRFHGTLQGDNLTDRFREAQVLVVPSSYEGFGIVYLEAMGFGCPVIASASGATDEIVRHESTGFLVPPGDVFSLTRRIESLIEDRELLARMSLAAYDAFTDHPSWEDSMGGIEAFLRELADQPFPPSTMRKQPSPLG
jgi:glycosyltransferase involved in cell wall biosynthesis